MLKETLLFAGGVVVGAAVIYGAYRYYQYRKASDTVSSTESESFAYVELLTSKELTAWFRENISQFGENVKMMVVTPTEAHMGGLGYPAANELDINTNLLQLIFEDGENDTIKVLKTRLINFTDIDSNLQAHLIEQDGMLIVTV